VLRGVSITLRRNRIMGVIGESGSGKSTLALAIMRLLAPNLARLEGSVRLDGTELLALPEKAMRQLRGRRVAMIFQDPMNALNPVFTIETQIVDFLREKYPELSRRACRERAVAMLGRVGIADAARRIRDYPHQFSGGMRQRIVIAMALLAEADLLIADEPTTALDATIEAQIMDLFEQIRRELRGSMLFVSHSLGLVAALCDDVTVMYAGAVMEVAPAAQLFAAPLHPYTAALLACELDDGEAGRAPSIPGDLPDLARIPTGCPFAPRCRDAEPRCTTATPELRLISPERHVACVKAEAYEAAING
jgi:oligopeptide/dipeptide ABC transporter ATP-binding protein